MDRVRKLASFALFAACGGASARDVPVVESFDEPAGELRLLGAIAFADGATVDGIAVAPSRARAGEPVVARFRSSASGRYRVGIRPPRDAARQVVRGGVGALPAEVPPDARARFLELEVIELGEVAIDLPEPWHPRRAALTIERLAGSERVAAIDGPRTASGIGLLATVAVETTPTAAAAVRATAPIVVDGGLDDAAWTAREPLALVASLDGEPVDGEPTTVRFAWDDEALFVAAELPDPDAWSTFARRDDPLWKEEAFELFVFGAAAAEPSGYVELQVSPRGVQFDSRFVRQRDGDTGWDGRWTTAVELRGTVDDRTDRDEGWTVELRVPWTDLCETTTVVCPPAAGSVLRINAFRLERPARGATIGLALSPTRVPDFHAAANAATVELRP